MRKLLVKGWSAVFGPPHGTPICWAAEIATLAWCLILLIVALVWDDYRGLFLALPVVCLTTCKWHSVQALLLIPGGMLLLGFVIMLSHVMGQSPPEPVLFSVAVIASGVMHLAAWFSERKTAETGLDWCQRCGSRLWGAATCSLCGEKRPPGEEVLCPSCGCHLWPDAKSCKVCGRGVKQIAG